jgi:hypothetical protein
MKGPNRPDLPQNRYPRGREPRGDIALVRRCQIGRVQGLLSSWEPPMCDSGERLEWMRQEPASGGPA